MMNGQSVKKGMMSHIDIERAISEKDLIITGDDRKITPAGVNLRFSPIIFSLASKSMIPIKKEKDNHCYIEIEAGDMIFALTQESIWVSKNVGGTVHSKVKYVSLGLGHVSTTIDPGWGGQLLIALNNPLSTPIKIDVGINDNNTIEFETFITVCLYYLNSAAEYSSDNEPGRIFTLIDNIGDIKSIKKLRDHLNDQGRLVHKLNTIKKTNDDLESMGGSDDTKEKNKTDLIKAMDEFEKIQEIIMKEMNRICDNIWSEST